MCTIEDSDNRGNYMEAKDVSSVFYRSVCRKCNKVQANVVLQSKFAYCRDCFLTAVSHKYRSTLGKSKLMRHGDRVLFVYLGNGSSVSLLDLFLCAENSGKKKSMNVQIIFLFLDETPALEKDDANKSKIITLVKESVKECDFEKYYCPLDSIYDDRPVPVKLDAAHNYTRSNKRIQECLLKCKSRTSALDFLKQVRYQLLYMLAAELSCNKIFLPQTSDDLAISIVSNIALGRGGDLSLDVGFMDNRNKDVVFLRPLCEISKKEVAFYSIFKKLKSITIPNLANEVKTENSIQMLTENFILNLVGSFPSTVHTVLATGAKLMLYDKESLDSCYLCKAVLSNKNGVLTSVKATKISSRVSALGVKSSERMPITDTSYSDKGQCSTNSCCLMKQTPQAHNMCYSCALIAQDFESTETWPPTMQPLVEEEYSFDSMQQEIEDFLL